MKSDSPRFAKRLSTRGSILKRNEKGMTLMDVVITVAIVLALTAVGLIAYSNITKNAKVSAVSSAATQVYSAAFAYENDSDPETDRETALNEYNDTANGIKVTSTTKPATLSVTATNTEDNTITSTRTSAGDAE